MALQIEGISKSFPGVRALEQVTLEVKSGEIHSLVGENGAGKSTLIKILMGVYQKDAGRIVLDGKEVQINNPLEARKLGLNAVYQDVTVAPQLTVGENFYIGKLPTYRIGLVNWKEVYNRSKLMLEDLGVYIDPHRKIIDLSPGEQAMVTISKIVQDKARFVIFDEPTARLTGEETEQLFQLIQRLKQENLGIIYISHHLEEIFQISDTVTTLRDGKVVGTFPITDVDEAKLISMMVGRTIEEMYNISHAQLGEVVLEVRKLTHVPHFQNISFQLHRGEVLGLFGLVGAGRTNLLRSLFGADRIDSGDLFIHGEKSNLRDPNSAIQRGVGLVPEERKLQGLAMPLTVRHNINISSYSDITNIGVVNLRKEKERSEKMVSDLQIRTPSIQKTVNQLSGGNQQKVAIAKWLCKDADVLLLDEPTTGVDVGAKVEIYSLIESLVHRGKAVIICSSYLPEVIGLSDRILVMREGVLTGEVMRKDANEELLLTLASSAE